jgi:predicted lysophospholipase L1 biosynthesis ABC-type transport system permease subunit
MMTTWRYYGDVTVILLCVLAVGVALAPVQRWGAVMPRRLLRIMAWTASAMLGLRGLAGMIVDGVSDPIWWPIFLAGGLLFGAIAYLHPNEKTA